MSSAALVDTVLFNGRIYTLTDDNPQVSALAIKNGRVIAVGSDEAMQALLADSSRHVDLAGQTVLPGLIDAHIHWQWTSRTMHEVDVFEVPSKDEALRRVAERVKSLASGEWVRGHGWMQDMWADKAFPTAADLDTVAPENPVYLTGKSVHVAWANSAALQAAGITAATPDPEGGEIVRDADGDPTGILLESPAMRMVGDKIPPPSPERLAEMMLTAQAKAHRLGITGIHDLDDPDCLIALQLLKARGELGLRVAKYINKAYFQAALDSGIRFGLGDDWIHLTGLKLFADGALGPRTAYMLAPYEGESNNIGIVVTSKNEMQELALQASRHGMPTAIHAIGDRAVREVLDLFQAVRSDEQQRGVTPDQRRHRIEHVQLIHADDVSRLAQLDLIASMQPIHATSDAETADRYWGARAQLSYNIRAQIDAGAKIALGSDSPIETFDPFIGIHAAVTRQRGDNALGDDGWRPDAKLTVDEAIRGFTRGAAYAVGREDRQGFLGIGSYADLIVLDRDPYQIDPHELRDVQVLKTMVDGVWRYER